MHGFGKGLAALALLPDLLRRLQWNPDAMRAAIEPSMYATDRAIDLARDGMPFRDAYQRAADPAQWPWGRRREPGRAHVAGWRGRPAAGCAA